MSLALAQQAFKRLSPLLSLESREVIAQRIALWQAEAVRSEPTRVSLPELVMRPGLPPRPLNKHYFKVIRSL